MVAAKRYALFVFLVEYPAGGWGDFVAAYETLKEAKAHFALLQEGLAQIVDLEHLRVVKKKLHRNRPPYRQDLN